MSDIQNLPISRQRHLQQQVQQRQILAMMGIGQWIQSESATLLIEEIPYPAEMVPINKSMQLSANHPVAEPFSEQDGIHLDAVNPAVLSLVTADTKLINSEKVKTTDTVADLSTSNPARQNMPTVADAVEQITTPVSSNSFDITNDNNDSLNKVAPFDLQGGRYNNWVLLVDIQALTSDSQKLWQNIMQVLSLKCETISFPICAGMDTVELANASFAGYLFRIGRSEESQVAALTELPAGLTHPNLVNVTTLEAMLADSALKRQLWQQISQ